MLKKIRIRNFKCYGPKGALFDLARINFIYGDNSVGKSSFLQFLEMLLKSVDCEAKYHRDAFDRHLFKGINRDGAGNRVGIYAKLRFLTVDEAVPVDLEFQQKENDEQSSFYQLTASRNEEINVALWDKLLPKDGGQDRIVRMSAPRSKAAIVSGNHADADETGSDLVSDHFLNKVTLEMDSDARQYLDDIFERLGIPYQCVVDANGSIAEWRIHDKDFDIDLDIDDVGTGIAGLIRLAFILKDWKGGILAIEEPETNINENQLAALTKVLVEEALKRPNGQLIVECHSEHVIAKLRGLLARNVLLPNDLSVTVLKKDKQGSIPRKIEFDKNGNVMTAWPGGYFPALANILEETYKI